jgi:hypothetical protein
MELGQEPPSGAHSEVRSILERSAAAFLVFALLYAFFYAIHSAFPYVQSGADQVATLKHDLASNGRAFRSSNRLHIMVFGKSGVLTGLIPSVFDRELAAARIDVESYNFGLPGDARFVRDLEVMIARGTAPDVVLLTAPWPDSFSPGPSVFHFVENDEAIMDRFFPFRRLPRDVAIMAAEAHGNPVEFHRKYVENEHSIKQVEIDRGFFFIARQSHFPNNQLPSDFRLPTDRPGFVASRRVGRGPVFERLAALFAAHNITCLFVPFYVRESEFGPAPAVNIESVRTLADHPSFGVLGPDYFRYPNALFADIRHVNPLGAEVYTRSIAGLVAAWLEQHPAIR